MGRPLRAVFVRKQAKDHGARQLIEGLAPGESVRGKRVAVLEDVTTTGGSAMKAIEALKAEGAAIARVISLVDRLEGAADAFRRAGIPFTALLTAADLSLTRRLRRALAHLLGAFGCPLGPVDRFPVPDFCFCCGRVSAPVAASRLCGSVGDVVGAADARRPARPRSIPSTSDGSSITL